MRKISLFWEIYFWIVFLGFITLLGVVLIRDFNFFENPFTKTYEVFFAITAIISILGIRGYIYKKRYFSKDIWIFLFSVMIVDFIGNMIFDFDYIYFENLKYFMGYLFLIPWYFALYKYTFKMEEVWLNI